MPYNSMTLRDLTVEAKPLNAPITIASPNCAPQHSRRRSHRSLSAEYECDAAMPSRRKSKRMFQLNNPLYCIQLVFSSH